MSRSGSGDRRLRRGSAGEVWYAVQCLLWPVDASAAARRRVCNAGSRDSRG